MITLQKKNWARNDEKSKRRVVIIYSTKKNEILRANTHQASRELFGYTVEETQCNRLLLFYAFQKTIYIVT